jgi:hypothetical protein
MYPAQGFADGLFSSGDLPSSVIIDGIVFSVSGTSYGSAVSGVILEGNVWAKYTNGSRSSQLCLMQGGVEDQFADTYYLSATFPGRPEESLSNVPMTRSGPCSWNGPSSTTLQYFARFYNIFNPGFRDDWRIGFNGIDSTVASGSRLNTPVGAYNDRFNFINISVS